MKRMVTIRDLIRLYHTEPIPERIIERTDNFGKLLQNLKKERNLTKAFTILVEIYNNNEWKRMHILPDWFVKKYSISREELTYISKLDEPVVLRFEMFSNEIKEQFEVIVKTNNQIKELFKNEELRIVVEHCEVIVERRKENVRNIQQE